MAGSPEKHYDYTLQDRLTQSVDLSVLAVQSGEFLPSDTAELARIEAFVTPELLAEGGLYTLLNRFRGEKRPWIASEQISEHYGSPGIILMSLLVPAADYTAYDPEVIRLFAARRTPTGQLGQTGLVTTVGFRPAGNPANVVPLCADNPALAWTANKMLAFSTAVA